MTFETLPEWLDWLEGQHHSTHIELGLERITQVARQLSLTELNATVITVAGTNGKGSYVHAMKSMLQAMGKMVACYTSPHFIEFNERIQVNGVNASDEEIIQGFQAISKLEGSEKLTYFEFTTLVALSIFKNHPLDYVILEVGLGGRLDAVNIVEPDLAILTSIALDHQDYLGNTLEKIASEKLGILRENTPLVSVVNESLEPITEAVKVRKSFVLGRDFELKEKGSLYSFNTLGDLAEPSFEFSSNGLSPYSVTAAVISCLYLESEASDNFDFKAVIEKLSLPGRFSEYDLDGIKLILDVAHNPQAASLLHKRLGQMKLAEGAKRIAIFGAMKDKDVQAIVSLLEHDFNAWFLVDLDVDRAYPASELADIVAQSDCRMISVNKNVRQAFARVKSFCRPGDQIIAFGSFFVVSGLMAKMNYE